jgi:hypothetical protein
MNLNYFSLSEFDCPSLDGSGVNMDSQFLTKLESAREIAGIPFKSQADTEQKNITKTYLKEGIKHLRTPPILLESQQTLLCLAEVKDTLYLMPLSKQGLNVLELQRPSSIAIPTQVNLTLFGHTNTTGSTLWKKKEKSLKIPK